MVFIQPKKEPQPQTRDTEDSPAVEIDQWSETVHHPGYSLACSPSHGTLAANTSACFSVSVFADTWGLYYDQIIILIEQLEPLVIDVWVEVVGSPLSFALRTRDSPWPVLW
ncbi:hypothetical protein KGM_209411 [Danaus plexippus plexippus]|nr:hypothetical protein KGM_209411 [Danaus plexippus plexippus]